jgi:hypothetical protein
MGDSESRMASSLLTGTGGYDILQFTPPNHEGNWVLNTKGAILKLAYQLRRHFWAEVPLSRWLGALLLAACLGSLLVHWLRPWAAVLIGLLYLAYVLILAWALRREYFHYEPIPSMARLDKNPAHDPPLRPEELVPVRASGWFSVEGQDRYYVDLEADFETVGTREHIVLGRVRPSRFMYFGQWSSEELGWWYIFFQPDMIRQMELGNLYYGPEPRQVLRLAYAPNAETVETIFLGFHEEAALRRVWADLVRDAPPDLALPGADYQSSD